MSDCCCYPGVGKLPDKLSAPNYNSYNPSEVRLYGRPAECELGNAGAEESSEEELGVEGQARGQVEISALRLMIRTSKGRCHLRIDPGLDVNIQSIGVIYGYAYEGHCYKLPKPQIMFLPEEPRQILGGDCGCDCGYTPELGYAVWQIDKLERAVALDVRSDDLKTLVLDENIPGNRSPLAYSQTMRLAPNRSRDY
jgi:hypothetical protein